MLLFHFSTKQSIKTTGFVKNGGQSSSDMEVSNTEEERVKPVRKKSSPNALKKAGSEASLQVKKKRKLYELTVADVRMILEAKGAASDGLNLLTEDAVAFRKKGEKGTICFSSYFNRFFLDVGGGEIGFYAFGMSPEEKQMWREACCKDTQFSHFTMAMKKGNPTLQFSVIHPLYISMIHFPWFSVCFHLYIRCLYPP